jgi:PST family polysaccharide transporter
LTKSAFPLAVATVSAKALSVAILLVLPVQGATLTLVAAALAGPSLIAGLCVLAYLTTHAGLRLVPVPPGRVLSAIRSGWIIATGNFAVLCYRELNVLTLGAAGASPESVASYALAERAVKGVQAMTRPFSQVAFPQIVEQFASPQEINAVRTASVWRILTPQIVCLLMLLGAAGLLVGVPRLRELVPPSLQSAMPSPQTFFIASFAPMFGVANFAFGVVGLTYLGLQGFFLRAIVVVGVANLLLCYLAARLWAEVGAAMVFSLAEALLLALVLLKLRRHSIRG